MKRALRVAAVVVVLAVLALAFALSWTSRCPDMPVQPVLRGGTTTMPAATYHCYGPPQETVQVEHVPKPAPAADEVLVRVRAAAVNPVDWHYVRGEPYVMRLSAGLGRPRDVRLGVDFSGIVEAVGEDVTRFQPGDAVFGARGGALAQYVTVKESRNVRPMPSRLSFEQAGSVGVAAVTALQAVRDHGQVRGAGQRVLINGASGGVGTFAVQIAKAFGAEVTGVCSTRNVELVRSLGADHVVDYTREDFTQGTEPYDVVIDTVGNRSFREVARALRPDGRYVIVGGPSENRWLGALLTPLKAWVQSPFVEPSFKFFIAEINPEDLQVLGRLMEEGKVTPVIDRTYSLDDAAAALGYLERGRARGKVVVIPASEPVAAAVALPTWRAANPGDQG